MEFLWTGSQSLGNESQLFTHVLHTHYSAPQTFDFEDGHMGISDSNVQQRSRDLVDIVKVIPSLPFISFCLFIHRNVLPRIVPITCQLLSEMISNLKMLHINLVTWTNCFVKSTEISNTMSTSNTLQSQNTSMQFLQAQRRTLSNSQPTLVISSHMPTMMIPIGRYVRVSCKI